MVQLIKTEMVEFHKLAAPIIEGALGYLERLTSRFSKMPIHSPLLLTTCDELFEWGSKQATIISEKPDESAKLSNKIDNITRWCNKEINRYRGKLYAAVIPAQSRRGEINDLTAWCAQRCKSNQMGPDWVRLRTYRGAYGYSGPIIYLFRKHQDATAFKLTFG